MEWRAIHSAPKLNGVEILVIEEDGTVTQVSWDQEVIHYPGCKPTWEWCVPGSHQDEQGGCVTVDNPIGWMPLPEASPSEISRLKKLMI